MHVEAHDTITGQRLHASLDFASSGEGKQAALEAQRLAVRV
jgi:hypothetical protein